MKRLLHLLAGAVCGAVIGAAASLLFDQKSTQDFRQILTERWQYALDSAKEEMEKSEREMTAQFNVLKDG